MGLQATSLAIVLLIVFRLLPGHGAAPAVPYAVILVLAAAGMVGVRLLPWERMLRSEMGLRTLYAWSVLDILLITTLVGFTGGPLFGWTSNSMRPCRGGVAPIPT